jgi:hypothetical protein
MTVQHPVTDWYLAFDDLWELMRVNWQTHNPFTQSGMWAAGEHSVQGVLMVVDRPPYRGVLLHTQDGEADDYATIVTYGPKCNECGYQPYNALWYGNDDSNGAVIWSSSVITDLIANAEDNPPEKLHEDGCSHLRYPEEVSDDEATTSA